MPQKLTVRGPGEGPNPCRTRSAKRLLSSLELVKSKIQPNVISDTAARASWSTIHPLSEEDSAAVAILRSIRTKPPQKNLGCRVLKGF